MRFAYADPPYLGMGKSMYGFPEWDDPARHIALLDELAHFDGWAVSTHTRGLRTYLPATDETVRVCAWVKGFASWKPGISPAYAWEPVLLKPARTGTVTWKVRDWVSANITTQLQRDVKGAKPDAFCFWLFSAGGLEPEDEFVDLFPGSGAVSRCWEMWRRQATFLMPTQAEQISPPRLFEGVESAPDG